MKIRIIAFTVAALIIFCGSSVWEGAAAVSSDGTLPNTGLYVATNSFPRNMVVDIVNLENDMKVRVTVAAGLDTPGLLAILSADAAKRVGLTSGLTGRISMSQPPDPVAFARFNGEHYAEELNTVPRDFDDAAIVQTAPGSFSETYSDSGYYPEPDLGEDDYYVIADNDRNLSEESLDNVLFTEEDTADTILLSEADTAQARVMAEEKIISEEARPVPVPAVTRAAERSSVDSGDYTYQLVPAEERPPAASAYIIDPESIIPGISKNEPKKDDVDHYEYIKDFITEPTGTANTPPPKADSSPLSVPVISKLEAGKYYVQLGAFSSADLFDSEISRIDKGYPLALFNDGSGANSLYRMLLGPMNQGESGAVLQRFRSIGYKDAFVRRGN